MNEKNIPLLPALVFAFAFFYGCTGSGYDAAATELAGDLAPKVFSLNASDDMADYPPGMCIAMVCQNKSPTFPFNIFFDSSLKGGNCTFEECNETKFSDIVHGNYPNKMIRLFMYGAGHSMLSFSDANAYCNNSMKMSVKWLTGSKYSGYKLPTKERAECFLDKNVIPVYILYSNFTNADADRAGEIAKELSGAGPAIIVSEAELDNSNASRYAMVKDQLSRMKANCPKCLIALGVKMNGSSEYNVTQELFSDSSVLDNVDLLAYGINSRYFPQCKPDLPIWYANNFSKFMLRNYTRPSLITYVLFDQANSSDNSCTWSNESVDTAYSLLYSYVDAFVMNGIIGVSVYSLYGLGPLGCTNCAFINPNFDSGSGCSYSSNPQEAESRFSNYFGLCQAYYTGIGGNMSGIIPAVFSTGSRSCDFASYNSNIHNYIKETDSGVEPMLPDSYKIEAADTFFSCMGCIRNGIIPTDFVSSLIPNPSSRECSDYDKPIEIAADAFDMDPVLLRAIIWQESNFDQCAMSFVPESWNTCNTKNIPKEDLLLSCCPTPDKHYEDLDDTSYSITPCHPESYFATKGRKGGECKPCAYGLAQVIEYPSSIYKQYGDSLSSVPAVSACAANATEDGYPDFSPFRAYDGPCAYAYKFMTDYLPKAQDMVNSHLSELGLSSSDPDYEDRKTWYAVFLALDSMFGHQSKPACHASSESQLDWIEHFSRQKNRNSASECTAATFPEEDKCIGNPAYEKRKQCCGNKDFLDYVRYCEHGRTNNGYSQNSFSYAYNILEKYKGLTSGACPTLKCPDSADANKNIIKYRCETNSMESECCSAAKIGSTYSATYMCYVNPSTPPSCLKYCT